MSAGRAALCLQERLYCALLLLEILAKALLALASVLMMAEKSGGGRFRAL